MKPIIFMIMAGIGALLFWGGVQRGMKKVHTELRANQKITLAAQADLKESLENQIDYINSGNRAFSITHSLETQRWLEQITVMQPLNSEREK